MNEGHVYWLCAKFVIKSKSSLYFSDFLLDGLFALMVTRVFKHFIDRFMLMYGTT